MLNTLADFQPVTIDELPVKYATAGNGRIFYMLKTYQLKMFDAFRREAFQKIATPGTRLEGLRNLIRLAALLILMNASADVIQDLILGRKPEIPDLVVDNLWKLTPLYSRYARTRAIREGAGTALFMQLLPPAKFINALTKDIVTIGKLIGFTLSKEETKKYRKKFKGFETPASVPLVGKLYYWHFGKGAKITKEKEERERRKELEASSGNYLRKISKTSILPRKNSIRKSILAD